MKGVKKLSLEEKLTSLRQERGLTQTEAAEELGVSRQAVSKWETGAAVPATESLANLGRLYHVPVDYLLSEEAERAEEENAPEAGGIDAESTRKGIGRTATIWGVIALTLLALALGMCAGYFIGRSDHDGEIHLSVGEMVGEEVDLNSAGTFSLETGW